MTRVKTLSPVPLSGHLLVFMRLGARVLRVLLGGVGGLLVMDSVWLFTKGLFNFGVVLPCALGLGACALAFYWPRVLAWVRETRTRRVMWWGGWLVLLGWLCSWAAFTARVLHSDAQTTSSEAPVALIVLGSGTPGDTPSPVLQARLDVALAQAQHYPQATIVLSGGTGWKGVRSESRIMGEYLMQHGVPVHRLVFEEESTSTHENLMYSRDVLAHAGVLVNASVQIITSDFHTLRAQRIARKVGFQNVGARGSPTPLYVRYNACLREYFAFVSGWLLSEY